MHWPLHAWVAGRSTWASAATSTTRAGFRTRATARPSCYIVESGTPLYQQELAEHIKEQYAEILDELNAADVDEADEDDDEEEPDEICVRQWRDPALSSLCAAGAGEAVQLGSDSSRRGWP